MDELERTLLPRHEIDVVVVPEYRRFVGLQPDAEAPRLGHQMDAIVPPDRPEGAGTRRVGRVSREPEEASRGQIADLAQLSRLALFGQGSRRRLGTYVVSHAVRRRGDQRVPPAIPA